VVCVPVCDTVSLSHCNTDNDRLLLFAVKRYGVHYDNVYCWRPSSNRYQVLVFICYVTEKMRLADLLAAPNLGLGALGSKNSFMGFPSYWFHFLFD